MPSAPLVFTMRTTRAEHQHIGWIWIESCNCYTKRAIPNSFLEFDMALFYSINIICRLLNQRHSRLFTLSSHFFWPDTCLYLTNMRLVQHYHTKTALSDTATNT